MSQLPLNPPPFFWPKPSGDVIDLKVSDWICQQSCNSKTNWDVVLFGVPLSRSSISASGASEFPESFRRSWKGFSTYNIDYGVDLRNLSIADLGDVTMHFTDILRCHSNIKETMRGIREHYRQSFPIAIGGDHSITAMTISGIKEAEPEKRIGILQFDTHLDVRDLNEHGPTNGTPIRNLIENRIVKGEDVYNVGLHGFFNAPSLIQYAKEQRINVITLNKARVEGITNTINRAIAELEEKVDYIYVTIDMDVLDISFAPGVPASTAGGMRTDELFTGLYCAARSKKVMAMDIVCLDPTKDSFVQPTVKAGTYAFLTFLTGLMARS